MITIIIYQTAFYWVPYSTMKSNIFLEWKQQEFQWSGKVRCVQLQKAMDPTIHTQELCDTQNISVYSLARQKKYTEIVEGNPRWGRDHENNQHSFGSSHHCSLQTILIKWKFHRESTKTKKTPKKEEREGKKNKLFITIFSQFNGYL